MLSCEFCEISKNIFLNRTLLVAASISKKRIRNKYKVFAMQIRSLIYQWTEAGIQEGSVYKSVTKMLVKSWENTSEGVHFK